MQYAGLGNDGLSPRVRGNLGLAVAVPVPLGSIPACAGEPTRRNKTRIAKTVYPRVCGGTRRNRIPALHCAGLSPRVRGNPQFRRPSSGGPGSIPACAGEPRETRVALWRYAVYPRVCGGTVMFCPCANAQNGLSPRVRGNLGGRHRLGQPPGSIPACAGEPSVTPLCVCPPTVYPRACGGTHSARSAGRPGAGLSPRVRGNRRRNGAGRGLGRSIPACAGEPPCRRWSKTQ